MRGDSVYWYCNQVELCSYGIFVSRFPDGMTRTIMCVQTSWNIIVTLNLLKFSVYVE